MFYNNITNIIIINILECFKLSKKDQKAVWVMDGPTEEKQEKVYHFKNNWNVLKLYLL